MSPRRRLPKHVQQVITEAKLASLEREAAARSERIKAQLAAMTPEEKARQLQEDIELLYGKQD